MCWCVLVCCSAVRCTHGKRQARCASVLQCVVLHCSVLDSQRCSVLQPVAVCYSVMQFGHPLNGSREVCLCATVCCWLLQCVAHTKWVEGSVLQYVVVSCSV